MEQREQETEEAGAGSCGTKSKAAQSQLRSACQKEADTQGQTTYSFSPWDSERACKGEASILMGEEPTEPIKLSRKQIMRHGRGELVGTHKPKESRTGAGQAGEEREEATKKWKNEAANRKGGFKSIGRGHAS